MGVGLALRIALFGINSADTFSGGRYYAWMVAECLALKGHKVEFITNNLPFFYDDFEDFPSHGDVELHISADMWSKRPEGAFDVVLVVPHSVPALSPFLKAILFAHECAARLALLNFESGNWFNSVAPEPRDLDRWDGWKRVAQEAAAIISLTSEGDKHAQDFYTDCSNDTIFGYCHAGINTIVADRLPAPPKERRIMLITRFSNASHKGGNIAVNLVSEAMRGYTLVLLVGSGKIPESTQEALEERAARHGVTLDIKYRLSDRDKLAELKRCSLMIFPSLFEGFGLPPVEAQYCNVPCIAFDLPVLREVSGDGLFYVPLGDWNAFRDKIKEVLEMDYPSAHLHNQIAGVAKVEFFAERIDALMQSAMVVPMPNGAFRRLRLRRELKTNLRKEAREQVRTVSTKNPTWNSQKIIRVLAKRGVVVTESMVEKYMVRAPINEAR